MNSGKTIFAQLIQHLPRYEFNQCVLRYHGNHKVRSFSCTDQFLCMVPASSEPVLAVVGKVGDQKIMSIKQRSVVVCV